MKRIKNEDLKKALDSIKNSELVDDQGRLTKEYKSYVASIGASIINSGVLPTLAFYTDIHKKKKKVEEEKKETRRYKLLKVLFHVMYEKEGNEQFWDLDNGLLEYALNAGSANQSESKKALKNIRQRILEAARATKLAMRNFEPKPEQS